MGSHCGCSFYYWGRIGSHYNPYCFRLQFAKPVSQTLSAASCAIRLRPITSSSTKFHISKSYRSKAKYTTTIHCAICRIGDNSTGALLLGQTQQIGGKTDKPAPFFCLLFFLLSLLVLLGFLGLLSSSSR